MAKPAQIEELNIVLVDEDVLADVERYVAACERCTENASIALDYVLDAITGYDPTVTTYLMRRPARCRSCASKITENTLVSV